MSKDVIDEAGMPLAFNTRDGVAMESAAVFRDAEGRWWSIQARRPQEKTLFAQRTARPHSHLQDASGKVGHISFVRLAGRPSWLTYKDVSNLRVALEMNQMLYRGNVVTFRTQDEADEAFKEAHSGRGLFVR